MQTLAAQEAKTWQLKQQRQQRKRQRRLKNDLVLKLRISREFELIQFVYTVRIIPNRMSDSFKIRRRNFENWRRIVHVLSNVQNVAISVVVLRTFVNNGKEMNKEL